MGWWDSVKNGAGDLAHGIEDAGGKAIGYVSDQWNKWNDRANRLADDALGFLESPVFLIVAGGVVLLILFKK